MSINRVLNRPMFRKEALRQGALKPITANTGVMVGQPYGSQVPAIRKSPTFMERMSVSKPVKLAKSLGKGILGIPQAGGYYAGDKVGQALGIESDLGRMPFGLAGAYYGAKALPTLAALPAATSAAILAGPAYLGIAGKMEYDRIQKMNPEEKAAHYAKSQQFGLEGYLNDEDFNKQFGKFVPKGPKEFDTKKSAAPKDGPGSGRPSGFGNKSKELKAEGDPLLQDNVANSEDIANLDLVQENSLGAENPTPPGEDDTNYTMTLAENRERREAEALLTAPEKKAQKAESTAQGTNEIALGGPSTDTEFNKTIALAKKYQEEVFKGEGSQAGLVFLSNLASGLLTGTTKRSGLGGAMEVFGQAIGPAVNNYATIKLKEGELRARNREASLNAAVDHMKFLNDAAITEAEGRKPPEIDQYGIIQVRGADGRLRNYTGIMYKNGTVGLPAGLDANGMEQYTPVPQGGPIKDSQGNVIGSFEQFKEQKTIGKDLIKYHDNLGNKYTALSITRDVLKTMNQVDSSGDPVKTGAALSIDQFTRRLTGVAQEVFGFEISDFSSADAKSDQLFEEEKLLIENDTSLDKKGRKEALALIDKDSLIKQAKKALKKTGRLSGLDRDEQEKLAVQEVSLVYALANAFKDKDRLTQRDIQNAQKIVNIFSLGRSSLDVKASINAIANLLESNIKTQETLYTVAGGLESTLTNLRQLKNFTPFEGEGGVAAQFAEDLSIEEIESILEGVE